MCSKEDVNLLCAEVAKGVAKGVFTSCSVGIESRNFSRRKDFTENGFGFFGSVSLKADCGVVAVGAEAGDDGLKSANMTNEALVSSVVGEWDGAVITLDNVTAGRTLEGAGKAAAVKKDNDLLVGLKPFVDRRTKNIRDDGITTFMFLGLDSHVDDAG